MAESADPPDREPPSACYPPNPRAAQSFQRLEDSDTSAYADEDRADLPQATKQMTSYGYWDALCCIVLPCTSSCHNHCVVTVVHHGHVPPRTCMQQRMILRCSPCGPPLHVGTVCPLGVSL